MRSLFPPVLETCGQRRHRLFPVRCGNGFLEGGGSPSRVHDERPLSLWQGQRPNDGGCVMQFDRTFYSHLSHLLVAHDQNGWLQREYVGIREDLEQELCGVSQLFLDGGGVDDVHETPDGRLELVNVFVADPLVTGNVDQTDRGFARDVVHSCKSSCISLAKMLLKMQCACLRCVLTMCRFRRVFDR